jgi:hypothetical protein
LLSTGIVVSTKADESDGTGLRELPVAMLAKRLDEARRPAVSTEPDTEPGYDAILRELVRRGGEPAQAILKRRLASSPEDLELLTAFRRLQRRLDPLAIRVEHPENLKAGTRDLPILEVAIENVDSEKRSIEFTFGGDNRSGRHDRWRIHVWDSEGKLLPHIPRWSSIGGGLYQTGPLVFGRRWKAQLRMSSYVNIRSPGKYKVQVFYHNEARVADIRDLKRLDELILVQSEPFELNVEHGPKISIDLEPGASEKAKDLIKSLDEKNKVRILLYDYDKEWHDFISPDSPQGQLLAMKWQSVPALLETLQDEKLTFRKRAWILALLISIVRERDLDPAARDGVLPDYSCRGSFNFWVTSESGASGSEGGSGSISSGGEDVNEQLRLAKEWLRFRDEYLDIRAAK